MKNSIYCPLCGCTLFLFIKQKEDCSVCQISVEDFLNRFPEQARLLNEGH